jgi:hypothetical protein
MNKSAFIKITSIWLAWVLVVIGFQTLAINRFKPVFPDHAQEWTEKETGAKYQQGRVYLLEPFMNNQVAWDSEYYLSIAIHGYDDPRVYNLTPSGPQIFNEATMANYQKIADQSVALNHAFFPLYPWMIRIFSLLAGLFRMNAIATATLAGVVVSSLGALGAMLALYDLTKDSLEDEGAMRAVFYLIIFPTAFFMVQVYTEGLFVGLAFGCLAMLKRGNWVLAALLGAAATLTRAVGVALIIPMAITYFRGGDWIELDLEWRQIYFHGIPWRPLGKAMLAFAPLIAFGVWKFSHLGIMFNFVESNYFGRGTLDLGYAFYSWTEALKGIFSGLPGRSAYWLTEVIGLVIGVVACIACLKHEPEIAWFSLAVLLISWGSGPAQGIQRYVLAAPAVFIMFARWGKNPVFDRTWTIASLLLMGLLATMFAFNFWVA